jgi:hypothetical protein
MWRLASSSVLSGTARKMVAGFFVFLFSNPDILLFRTLGEAFQSKRYISMQVVTIQLFG